MSDVTVSVFASGVKLTEKDRPVRGLPGGGYGVVYQGRVYPIRPGLTVHVDGPSHPPDQCPVLRDTPPELLPAGSPTPIEQIPIHIDDSGDHVLVMVGGSLEDLQVVLRDCVAGGLQVLGGGVSDRPANDGVKYDWFIRIGPPDGDSDQEAGSDEPSPDEPTATPSQLLDSTLAPIPPAVGVVPDERLTSLATTLDRVEKENYSLRVQLLESHDEIRTSGSRVAKLEAELKAAEVSAGQREAVLQSVLSESSRVGGHEATLTTENTALRTSNASLSADLTAARCELEEAERLGNGYANENQQLKLQLESCEDAASPSSTVRALVEETRRSRGHSKTLQQRLECLIAELLPSIVLVRNSVDRLLDEFQIQGLKAMAKHLRTLQASEKVGAKRVKGTTNWWEIDHGKFKPDERIYYLTRDGRCNVYLGTKQTQDADIDWLKAND